MTCGNHSPVRPARRHISADPKTIRRPRSTSADHRPRPHQWWTCESQYGIRQDSRNLPRTDRDLGHLRREGRSSSHLPQDSTFQCEYRLLESECNRSSSVSCMCASSRSRRMSVTQFVSPRQPELLSVRYITSTRFTVCGRRQP